MFDRPGWQFRLALLVWFASLNALNGQDEETNANQLMFVPPPIEGGLISVI